MKTQRPIFVLLSILYLLSTLSLFAKKNSFKLPQYNCVHIDQKIEIDGKLNESVWKQAKAVQLAKTDTGKLPNKKTEAKMLWDNQYLYVGFICSDNDIWATISDHDGPIYSEEVVEVFIDPNNDQKTYIELEVNPMNTLFDGFVINGKQQQLGIKVLLDWESTELKHAIFITGTLKTSHPNQRIGHGQPDQSWSCEMAIPFADCITAPNIPPKEGDEWKLNLYRIERGKTKKEDEYSAWSPTRKIDYHRPQHFGDLRFIGPKQ